MATTSLIGNTPPPPTVGGAFLKNLAQRIYRFANNVVNGAGGNHNHQPQDAVEHVAYTLPPRLRILGIFDEQEHAVEEPHESRRKQSQENWVENGLAYLTY